MIAPEKHHRRRGVVLIAVLVFIFMLVVIVTLFVDEVEDRIYYRAQTRSSEDMRQIANNYLEHALGVLSEFREFDEGIHAPGQGWGDPLGYAPFPIRYPGLDASIRITDLSGRLSVHMLTEESFPVFLEVLGVNPFEASRLRDLYFDWIDADDERRMQGAEREDYERDNRTTLLPPNAPIEDLDEFLHIMGFRDWVDPQSRAYHPERFALFRSLLTTLPAAPVNLNVADPLLLEFFQQHSGLDALTLSRHMAGRDRVSGTQHDRWVSGRLDTLPDFVRLGLGDGLNEWYGFDVNTLKIEVDLLRFGSSRFRLEAVIRMSGSTPIESSDREDVSGVGISQPFEILVIREKFMESDW